MTNEEFLKDICPNHTDKSKWNKSELLHILDKYQAVQLQQGGVMARFNISEDELIKELEDKRICKLSDLPEDIYYLHRKETARWFLEKYDVFKKCCITFCS